jgi:hypothetical protein
MTKTLEREILILAPVEKVFAFMDDLTQTGMHMSERSMMMMGSKLELERLPGPEKGVGATFRWSGKVLGLPVDFTETVTYWKENEGKVWETVGSPLMIILGWYRIRLITKPNGEGTSVSLEIEYEPPKGFFYTLLSAVFSRWYAVWCLSKMLGDTKRTLEKEKVKSNLQQIGV